MQDESNLYCPAIRVMDVNYAVTLLQFSFIS